MAFADRPLRDVLSELAARQPVPGGGASAAWACALGAGLVEMAAAYGDLDAIGGEARELRARALELAERDGEGYARVLEAHEDGPLRSLRAERLADALSAAAEAPLQIALRVGPRRRARRGGVRDGTVNLRGDAAAARAIAAGACEAAAGLVEVDVGGREPPDPRVAQGRDAVRRARAA